jgi:hypothetical protein
MKAKYGCRPHIDGQQPSSWTCARATVSYLGGADNGLSEAQLSLVRWCATLECELEAMEVLHINLGNEGTSQC